MGAWHTFIEALGYAGKAPDACACQEIEIKNFSGALFDGFLGSLDETWFLRHFERVEWDSEGMADELERGKSE